MNSTIQANSPATPKKAGAASAKSATPSILLVDDSTFCRELVSEVLRASGFVVEAAGDGQEALSVLGKAPVDIILLDNEMPVMDGLGFLKSLRADARWGSLPVIMLTSSAAKSVIVEASRYRVCGYLVKERFSMPELLFRVRNALGQDREMKPAAPAAAPPSSAPAQSAPVKPRPLPPAVKAKTPAPKAAMPVMSVPNLIARDVTLAGLSEITSAKTLSGAASQVIAMTASAKPNFAEVAGVIRQDPVLAVRVLQRAASAAVSATKSRLANIDDAVRILGIDAVRDLAVSIGVFKAFSEEGADGIDIVRCWQHAFATAVVMGRIVPRTDTIPPGIPHLTGLFHDLPELLLRQKFPAEYAAASDFALQGKLPVTDLLSRVFGVPYSELVASLLDRLKIPSQIVEPIKVFQQNPGLPIDAYEGTLPRSLAIADRIVHGMMLCSSSDDVVSPVSEDDCHRVLIPSAAINTLELKVEAVTIVSMLANLAPAEEAALSKPLISRRDTALWYIRHPSMAPLDPLETAVRNLVTRPQVRDRMPRADELTSAQGIILVSPTPGESQLGEAMRLRAILGKELPILNLTSRTESRDPATQKDGVEDATYPLPVSHLARFISTLATSA